MSAVASGVLLFAAFLPLPTAHLVWFALVPWLVQVERGRGAGDDALHQARDGAALFGTFWAFHLYWVLLLVPRIGEAWPVAAWLGQVLLLALLGAAFGVALTSLRHRRGVPLVLAAPLAWLGVEWCRGHLLGPLDFPWSPLGLPLTAVPEFVQLAAWTGEAGLTLGVVGVNALLAKAWLEKRRGAVVVAALVLLAWWGSGRIRMANVGTEGVVVAAAVQPAIPLAMRRADPEADRVTLQTTQRLLATLPEGTVDVVVLPETHLAEALRFPGGELEGALAGWSGRVGAELLLGAFVDGEEGLQNAVVRVTPGGFEEHYAKVALVPGVEWTPGSSLVRGREPAPLGAPGRPGALICIESAWSGLARRHLLGGARWLVNVTNDAWLAEEPMWTRTSAFHQHPAHLALRSVETGLGALRVANNGLSGIASPTGEWTELIAPHRAGVGVGTVESLSGSTFFGRTGDLLGPSAFLAALLGWLLALGASLARDRGRLSGPPTNATPPVDPAGADL